MMKRRNWRSRVSGSRSGPDFDGEAGVLVVERVRRHETWRLFADGADVEFVAGSVGPVSEMTVVHPATPVMHFVAFYAWPSDTGLLEQNGERSRDFSS